jgi:hypothetical protein
MEITIKTIVKTSKYIALILILCFILNISLMVFTLISKIIWLILVYLFDVLSLVGEAMKENIFLIALWIGVLSLIAKISFA